MESVRVHMRGKHPRAQIPSLLSCIVSAKLRYCNNPTKRITFNSREACVASYFAFVRLDLVFFPAHQFCSHALLEL